MREDPIEGEDVTLLVSAAGGEDLQRLETAIEDAGGTIEAELEFASLRVTIGQDCLDDLCSLDGIDAIETDSVTGVGGDAGEDV